MCFSLHSKVYDLWNRTGSAGGRSNWFLSSRRKMYWLINAGLDKVQLNCFQQQKCKPSAGGYTEGADGLCWDSSWECTHHQADSELQPSLTLVWIQTALLCPVNYTSKCPWAQLGKAATAGPMDLREESRNSFRLSWNGILTQELPFSFTQPILACYCLMPRCHMAAMSFGQKSLTATPGNVWLGINYGICGKVELRRKLHSWHLSSIWYSDLVLNTLHYFLQC